MIDPIIRAQGVSVSFRTNHGLLDVLSDFNLDIWPGEIVCIVGASGCGKSTFLNLLAGFISPTKGQVLLNDKPIHGVEPRCGMIFQNYALFPWMTILENVAFGPRLKGASRQQRQEVAQYWLSIVGLTKFADSYPGSLSGGMQQRVALGRALANDPAILLCDEPFAALDAMTRQILQEELLRIVSETNKTVLFITHAIDEALILSDRLAVMSARPGSVKVVHDNDLPRPRNADIQLTKRFLELKRETWDLVQEEVLRSLSVLG